MFEQHDCENCEKECSVRGIDKFLAENDIEEIIDSMGDVAQVIIDERMRMNPFLLEVMSDLIPILRAWGTAVYFKATQRPNIPKAFLE